MSVFMLTVAIVSTKTLIDAERYEFHFEASRFRFSDPKGNMHFFQDYSSKSPPPPPPPPPEKVQILRGARDSIPRPTCKGSTT